jgi:hypothetical protein
MAFSTSALSILLIALQLVSLSISSPVDYECVPKQTGKSNSNAAINVNEDASNGQANPYQASPYTSTKTTWAPSASSSAEVPVHLVHVGGVDASGTPMLKYK